jgi:hypothetical protein
MYDYGRTKTADHPGDLSVSEFALGYARALGTHLMTELNAATGNQWWFDKVGTIGHGVFNLSFTFLKSGQRLHVPVTLTLAFKGVHISMELPFGGMTQFTESVDDRPSAIAAAWARHLRGSFVGDQ